MTPAQLTPNPLPDEDDAATPEADARGSDADAPTPTKNAPAPTDEDAAPCVEIVIELPQLREKRRIDGVGRPKFDFYTGLRAGASRPYELARAARRAWSFGRGLSFHPD